MVMTYQLDKILHYLQDDKGLIYRRPILPNTYVVTTPTTAKKLTYKTNPKSKIRNPK